MSAVTKIARYERTSYMLNSRDSSSRHMLDKYDTDRKTSERKRGETKQNGKSFGEILAQLSKS
ncbi:MAG: hypothetical protein KF681_00630 [Bdellovibrionaceae bacterium]|nr:hypothetical protein [Pseudobdellovibrionaceae bacterium]